MSACDDVPPDAKYTCKEQAGWKKCDEPWMKNKCKKSCGRCSKRIGPTNTDSLLSLNLQVAGDQAHRFRLNIIDDTYRMNKARVMKAFRSVGLSGPKLKLCLAIGMQETNTLDPKDQDGATFSAWNYNYDFLNRVGITNHGELNSWSGLGKVAEACKKGIEKFTPYGFVNFHRGGYTGWKDPTKHNCYEYRNGVATIIRFLDKDPSLMTDNRRVTFYP